MSEPTGMGRSQRSDFQETIPALERLGKWLRRQGASDRDVRDLTRQLEGFHGDTSGILRSAASVAVSAGKSESGGFEIRLRVLWPPEIIASVERNNLTGAISAAFGPVAMFRGAKVTLRLDFIDEVPQEEDAHFLGILGMTSEEEAVGARLARELSEIDAKLKAALRSAE